MSPASRHEPAPLQTPSSGPHAKDASEAALAWLVRRHSGEMGLAEQAAFEAWRAHPVHAAAWREAEALWRDAGALRVTAGHGFAAPGMPVPRARAIGRRGWVALAASVAAGAVLVGRSGDLLADYATGIGETRRIDLPDGSTLHLGADSRVDLAFSADRRQVLLGRGEAMFEVAADPQRRPFIVEAGRIACSTAEARFDVRLGGDGEVRVAVAEHAVHVAALAGTTIMPALPAGQALTIDATGRAAAPRRISDTAVGAWRRGLLVAEGLTLAEVVDALGRYHRVWILLRGAELGNRRVNAVLDLPDLDRSLQLLAAALPLRIRRPLPLLVVIEPTA